MIYLDHNATTPVDERVVEAMLPYLQRFYGNPSSLYRFGRIARSAVDTAREQVAALIDASPNQITFTSGGTEANTQALAFARGRAVWLSAIEHPSVSDNASGNRAHYPQIGQIPVGRSGLVAEATIADLPLKPGDFVSLMLANNETGAIQPVRFLAAAAVEKAVIVHTDAVQALGKIPVSFRQLGVSLMSLSSHKIYGPKGCGALVRAMDTELQPLLFGGDQEAGLRAGTENVAAIVGFGKAAELTKLELQHRVDTAKRLRLRLERQLNRIPGLTIFAEAVERLPNTVQFGVQGVNGEMLLMRLDKQGIAVSSGSACAAGSDAVSPVLAAMGLSADLAKSAIRVSLGKDNSENDVDNFVNALKALLEK